MNTHFRNAGTIALNGDYWSHQICPERVDASIDLYQVLRGILT
jgi:hypothetical protein